MTTLAELADSFNAAYTAVDTALQYEAGALGDEAAMRRGKMASQLVTAWCREADAFLGIVAPQAPQQAALPIQAPSVQPVASPPPAPGPLADTLAKIAAGLQQAPVAPPAPAPAPDDGVRGSFDEWVALSDALGRNVQDVMRQWYSPRDGIEGGWDKATDEQRAEQMRKALAYYANKTAEPGEIDYTVCFKCGSKGEQHMTRNNEPFFKCSNPKCGFNGNSGWVSTMWDATNYSEKRAKWEDTKRRGQQRNYGRR